MDHQPTHIDYYQLSAEEALKNLKSTPDGLSDAESVQRTKIYGENKLITAKKTLLIFKFLEQFKDAMVIILIVAGSLSLYLHEYRDSAIMYTIVLVNAVIGFIQEYKAERVMNALKLLIKANAKVIRDGVEKEIEQEELVPGDIVKLEEGDAVPADLRIIEENLLATNDFSLTGESNPTRKFIHAINGKATLGDRNNIAFMGTTVATGNGIGVVIHTGMQTEIGRIANLSQEQSHDISPLQKEINHLANRLTIITISIGAIMTIVGLLMNFGTRDSILFGLGIAASCVPEGLPAQVSVALSLAAGRLAKQKAVVKKLSAVETLGCTHIICTDKTGTLTKNEMTVQKILIGIKEYDVTGIGYEPKGEIINSAGKKIDSAELAKNIIFFQTGTFASNASVNPPDTEHQNWYSIGDPTEAALITLSEKAGIKPREQDKQYPELKEFTFDSVRKRMSSLRNIDGKTISFLKGSPQGILEKCTHIKEGEQIRKITEKDKEIISQKNNEYATSALRVLAYAYKELPKFDKEISMDEAESDLIFVGLAAMIDPPREEVEAAIDAALKAHIRVIIITGDYALTAEAIAKRIGFAEDNTQVKVIKGAELDKMSDIDLLQELIHSSLIFSRTSPENKLRIVSLLKKAGEIVAVTGDGVNDAPALKKADIGVAMGKTGTEVAKDSSGIVLLDDSFATLVKAIREGRIIFQNLRKTIICSLTSNSGELFAVILSLIGTTFFGWPLAILAVQILAVDLVGEMLPLTFLTWDPPQDGIMSEPPRNPEEHIIKKSTLIDLAWSGLLMGAMGYLNFLFVFYRDGKTLISVSADNPFYMRATTVTYITIVLCQWFNILSRRAGRTKTAFTNYLWTNKRLWLSYAISLVFLLNICYNPYISPYLRTAPITLLDWSFALAGAITYFSVRELYKFFLRRYEETEDSTKKPQPLEEVVA